MAICRTHIPRLALAASLLLTAAGAHASDTVHAWSCEKVAKIGADIYAARTVGVSKREAQAPLMKPGMSPVVFTLTMTAIDIACDSETTSPAQAYRTVHSRCLPLVGRRL